MRIGAGILTARRSTARPAALSISDAIIAAVTPLAVGPPRQPAKEAHGSIHEKLSHDFLYWDQGRTRKESDDIFREAMGVLGVAGW